MLSREWCGGFAETCVLRRVQIKEERKTENEGPGIEGKVEWWLETVYWSPKKERLPLTGLYAPFRPLSDLYAKVLLGTIVNSMEKIICSSGAIKLNT